MREKKKDQIRTQDVTEFGLKMPVSGTPNLQQLRLSRNTKKNSFTLVELGPL
jgi:hypothetical protein